MSNSNLLSCVMSTKQLGRVDFKGHEQWAAYIVIQVIWTKRYCLDDFFINEPGNDMLSVTLLLGMRSIQ